MPAWHGKIEAAGVGPCARIPPLDRRRASVMSASKQRDRKCATCRHYQPSPLWRKGWCRNPLLFDPSTNHLVEADSLACQRAFIDYWEARSPKDLPAMGPSAATAEAPLTRPRVAPSIPLTPTGPGGQ